MKKLKQRITEDLDIKKGDYRFKSVDGFVQLSYRDKVIAQGDYDDESSYSYWLSHSSFKGQKSFGSAEDALEYFQKNRITTESTIREMLKHIIKEEVRRALIDSKKSRKRTS